MLSPILNWPEFQEHLLERIRAALSESGQRPGIVYKPKLPAHKKLARLAGQQEYKDVVLPTTVHYIRRFLAWRDQPEMIKPVDDLEESMFHLLSSLPERNPRVTLETYEWILARFDEIKEKHKQYLFHEAYLNLPTGVGVEKRQLASDLAYELIWAAKQAKLNAWGGLPGKVRQESVLVPSGDPDGGMKWVKREEPKIKIWEINKLRGAALEPVINPADYTDDEIEQECTYINFQKDSQQFFQVTCDKKKYNPSENWEGEHIGGICLHIPEISINEMVEVIGSNFFNDQVVVRISLKTDSQYKTTFKCNVDGDQATPIQDNAGTLINDTRVRDRLTFFIDNDTWTSHNMPAGVYNLQVGVPNTINWSSGGAAPPPMFWSSARPVRVRPHQADYKIIIDELYCAQETQPWDSVASDEVGVIAFGIKTDEQGNVTTWNVTEDMFNNSGLEDVDTGEKVGMDLWLLGDKMRTGLDAYERVTPNMNYALTLTGYDIDSEDVYKHQVQSSWDVFKEMWGWDKWTSDVLGGAVGFAKLVGWIGPLSAGIAGAIITAIKFLVTLILSWWAPPDLIMKDIITLSPTYLDYRTRLGTKIPIDYKYDVDKIHVLVQPVSKQMVPSLGNEPAYVEYVEKRKYVEDQSENSTYWLTLKYRRAV